MFGLLKTFVSNELIGHWVEIGSSAVPRGFVLHRDGVARSINAGGAQYTAWRRDGHTLTLWGKIMSDRGATIDFIESMRIGTITDDKLVLHRADETFEYTRE